jgi:hypothetical protein
MELIRGNLKVEFDYIGEGLSGDFNPEDPLDIPLLRFYISKLNPEGEWEYLEKGSYCTGVHADTDLATVAKLLGMIMEAITFTNCDKTKIAEFSYMDESWAN